MVKKIGILTGGGDCGGLNAAIESIVKYAIHKGMEVYGIKKGWGGLVTGDIQLLSISDVDGIHSQTGTILQTSRTNPYNYTGNLDGQFLKEANVSKLIRDYRTDITLIGIPKTMDGDLQVYSLGLDTAINRSMQVLEDFIPVLIANGSLGFVELFGRDVGRVTFKAGISAGADVILIPEIKIDLGYTCDFIAERYDARARRNHGTSYVLVAVAEGTENPVTGKRVYLNHGEDSFGHGKLGGIGDVLAKLVHDELKDDARITKHIQKIDIRTQRPTYDVRGGATSYSDSYVGQKLGLAAMRYLEQGGKSGMAVVNINKKGKIESMPIKTLIKPRYVHMGVLNEFEESGKNCFGRKLE